MKYNNQQPPDSSKYMIIHQYELIHHQYVRKLRIYIFSVSRLNRKKFTWCRGKTFL